MWQNTGTISGNSIVWNGSTSSYDNGVATSVALSDEILGVSKAVQSNVNANGTLADSASLLIDRSSWMENSMGRIGGKTLGQITMPGSHDAGMYSSSGISVLAEAQDLTINQQLYAGVRYFDLRPHWTGSDLEIYHGPIYVESVQTVLNDVQAFMATNRKELVILKVSHFDSFDTGSDGTIYTGEAYSTLTSWIQARIGTWLYTSLPEGARLGNIQLEKFLGSGGKVLVVIDEAPQVANNTTGIWTYRDWDSGDPQNGDLVVFDEYSNVTEFTNMENDQFAKFNAYNGYAQNNPSVPVDMFLLSWTLTPPVDVWFTVTAPDSSLGMEVNDVPIPNSNGKVINILYTDYSEYSRSTDTSVYLNSINEANNQVEPSQFQQTSAELTAQSIATDAATIVNDVEIAITDLENAGTTVENAVQSAVSDVSNFFSNLF